MMVYDWIKGAVAGLVEALGPASVRVELVDAPTGHGRVALVREGYVLRDLAGRFEGLRRHNFDDIDSFAAWLLRHGDPDTTEILVEPNGHVIALLDPSHPKGGDVITCQPAPHPRLVRWTSRFRTHLLQRDLHQHIVSSLEDFPEVDGSDGTQLGSAGALLAAQLLRVSVIKGGDVTVVLDELGYSRVTSGTRETTVTAKLPPRFAIRVPFLLGARASAIYEFEVFLSISLPAHPPEGAAEREGRVLFTLDCPNLQVVHQQAVADAAAYLAEVLGDDWLVGLGTARTVTVPVVE